MTKATEPSTTSPPLMSGAEALALMGMSRPPNGRQRDKSAFPDTVIDRAWWTRYCTAEHFDNLSKAREIIALLTENLVASAKQPGFSEGNSGMIENYGDLVEWLFERVDIDVTEIRGYLKELDANEASNGVGAS
jgi:hypothetical protein